MFEPPPSELKAVYDIVHIRLAIEGDPLPTLRNVFSLLKPGGHLQWDEMDLTRSSVMIGSDDASFDAVALTQMSRLMKS